jgi:hypothetical protein
MGINDTNWVAGRALRALFSDVSDPLYREGVPDPT